MKHATEHPAVPSHRCGGWSLVQVLATLTLLAAFSLVWTRLFLAIRQTDRYAHEARNNLAVIDPLVEQLRTDVWSAYAIALGNERTVVLRLPDNISISWQLDRHGGAERIESRGMRELGAQRWADLPEGLSFAADGPWLMIIEPRRADQSGRSVPLLSQLMLIRRSAP